MVNEGKTAYILQPHFQTMMFRPAVKDQQSDDWNYIIVTCSPDYNGVWKYDGSLKPTFTTVWNKGKNGSKLLCYEVPISSCSKIQALEAIKDADVRNRVKTMQEKWVSNQVNNRDYTYVKKPSWMLK
jgi:hypothetical protein